MSESLGSKEGFCSDRSVWGLANQRKCTHGIAAGVARKLQKEGGGEQGVSNGRG